MLRNSEIKHISYTVFQPVKCGIRQLISLYFIALGIMKDEIWSKSMSKFLWLRILQNLSHHYKTCLSEIWSIISVLEYTAEDEIFTQYHLAGSADGKTMALYGPCTVYHRNEYIFNECSSLQILRWWWWWW